MTTKTLLSILCFYLIQNRGQHNLALSILRPRPTIYSYLFTQNTVRSDMISQKMHTILLAPARTFLESLGEFRLPLQTLSGQSGMGKASRGGGKPVGSGVSRPCCVCIVLLGVGWGVHYKCSQSRVSWTQNRRLHQFQKAVPQRDEAARPGGV